MIKAFEQKRKSTATRLCKECGFSIPKECRPSFYIKKNFCSSECKGKAHGKSSTGENNSNFRGGKTSCSVCSIQLSKRYTTSDKKCKKCFTASNKGVNHTRFSGKNKLSPNGKYLPVCISCDEVTGDSNSVLCRKCYRGVLNPLWRGGTSKLSSLIRALPENRVWVKNCMKRDLFACTVCKTQGKLQVHHVYQFAKILKDNKIDSLEKARDCEQLWDINNGQTLCLPCHKLTDSYLKKI